MKKLLLLLLTGILAMALVACDDSTGSSGNSNDNQSESNDKGKEEKKKDEKLGVGDTAEFDDAKFTLKEVTTTDERNEFAEDDPTAVIKIDYELENTSDDELSYGMDLTVYDADGNKMESYPLDNTMGAVAPGKKVQGTEFFGVDALGAIEIHYAPIVSFDKAAVFEVEVE